MSKEVKTTTNVLHTIYVAGFNHGANEGPFPEHGTFEAFQRLIKSESPMLDDMYYDIKDKIIYIEEETDNSKLENTLLQEYTKWLMEVWNPNQLQIPFAQDAPKAFQDYKKSK